MRKNLSLIQNHLWTYRKKMGLSQKRVAYYAGLKTTNAFSKYEHGGKLPNLKNALKLEIVYRTPVAFLFPDLYGRLRNEIRQREEKLRKDLKSEE